MFDFDGAKILVIGIVALVVIKPKDLPRVFRQLGQTLGKLRRMAAEFQGQFMDAMREADMEDVRKDVTKLGDMAKIDTSFDPIGTIRREIGGALADKKTTTATAAVSTEASPLTEGSAEPTFNLGTTVPEEPVLAESLSRNQAFETAPVAEPATRGASADVEPAPSEPPRELVSAGEGPAHAPPPSVDARPAL